MKTFLLGFAFAFSGAMTSMADIAIDAAEGSGRIKLPDGRPAIQFDAAAPKDTAAKWNLPTPLEPGWYSVELGWGTDANTRKLVSIEWLDAAGNPVLSVDLYNAPGSKPQAALPMMGVFLSQPAVAIRWRKNQTRAVPSTPIASLSIKPGRPGAGSAFLEAVEAPVVSGVVQFPKDLGGGLLRAVSLSPLALKWIQANGESFTTPAATATSVFLDGNLSGLSAGSSANGSLCLEHRFESTSPVDEQLLKQPVIPLVGTGKQALTIDVRGTGLDGPAATLADFPGGARMAAVQSWDDGIPNDKRLAELLHKNGWRASFFFNRNSPMLDRWKELEDLEMEVGSHSWSHPFYWLQTPRRCHEESLGMRLFLENKTGHPVISFAYPFNYGAAYDAQGDYVLRAQQEAGYLSGRSTNAGALSLDDLGNPLAMKTDGHFLMPRDRIETAWNRAAGMQRGVFYIWGHSYELPKDADWTAFEEWLGNFGRRPEAWYASQGDLLVWKWLRENVMLSASGDSTHVVLRLERSTLHPWWAGRVPVAIQMPGEITQATANGKNLQVVNGQIQVDWPR